jgi:acyl carrier protein
MSVDKRVKDIFRSTFGIDDGDLSDLSSPQTVEGWDSIGHIQLVMTLEAEFEIQFDPNEIGELVSVALIRERIEAKSKGQ